MDKKAVEGVKELLRRVKGFRIKKAILFGSRAGEDWLKESDIDILLVSSDFRGIRFPSRAAEMLKWWNFSYGDPEFLCYTPEEFAKLKEKITIVREAAKEGISIEV